MSAYPAIDKLCDEAWKVLMEPESQGPGEPLAALRKNLPIDVFQAVESTCRLCFEWGYFMGIAQEPPPGTVVKHK